MNQHACLKIKPAVLKLNTLMKIHKEKLIFSQLFLHKTTRGKPSQISRLKLGDTIFHLTIFLYLNLYKLHKT